MSMSEAQQLNHRMTMYSLIIQQNPSTSASEHFRSITEHTRGRVEGGRPRPGWMTSSRMNVWRCSPFERDSLWPCVISTCYELLSTIALRLECPCNKCKNNETNLQQRRAILHVFKHQSNTLEILSLYPFIFKPCKTFWSVKGFLPLSFF